MNSQQIAAALQARVTEYELIRDVNTGNPEADQAFASAMEIALTDMRELIADIGHEATHQVALVRHLHLVN